VFNVDLQFFSLKKDIIFFFKNFKLHAYPTYKAYFPGSLMFRALATSLLAFKIITIPFQLVERFVDLQLGQTFSVVNLLQFLQT
jgi:hypothetical protein